MTTPQPSATSPRKGPLASWLARPADDPGKIVTVALVLSLFCATIVSTAAIALRATQEENRLNERQRNILQVAGIPDDGDTAAVFRKRVIPRVIDLARGTFTSDVDPLAYDMTSPDSAHVEALTSDRDTAKIRTLPVYANAYLITSPDGSGLDSIVLGVHGYGLWSTLYGFIALRDDLNTIVGLRFYEHGETPGLGGNVDTPQWQALWPGKTITDDEGVYRLRVGKPGDDPSEEPHRVDALAGASLTTRGIDNMLRFWIADDGYRTFLARHRQNPEALNHG